MTATTGPVPATGTSHVPLRGRVLRTPRWSARLDPRAIAVCAVLGVLVAAVACVAISVGDFPIPLSDVALTLVGRGSEDAAFIVGTLRLPRALVGVMVGAALGLSGAIFQSLARNPLGSPDIIGFTQGAAAGAVATIVIFDAGVPVALGGLGGGLAAALAVYLLAWRHGVQAYRLVLVGIGVGFTAMAIVEYLLTRAEIYDAQRAIVWLSGSLNGRSWEHVGPVGAGLLLLAPVAVWLQRWLDRLELGDDSAAALGVPVGPAKLALVVVGAALAALAVVSAGPITFVALLSGPIARRLVRSPAACLVPAAFVGALVTVAADLTARVAFAPVELPVGIATAVIGAPYLLWLLGRQIRAGAL